MAPLASMVKDWKDHGVEMEEAGGVVYLLYYRCLPAGRF